MIKETPVRIGFGYLVGLLATFYTTVVIFPIASAMEIAGPDGWISMVFGTVVGRMVNVFFVLYFIVVLAIAFRHATDLISIAVLMETPTWVLLVLVGFPAALGARLGIEVLGRTAQLYLAITIASCVLFSFSIGSAVELTALQPILRSGLGNILTGGLAPAAYFSEIFTVLWFLPYIKERRTLFRGAVTALALIGAFGLLVAVYTEGIFGYREVERQLFPVLNLVRAIRLGGVVERLDVIFISAWLLAIFLKISLFSYISSVQLAWVAGSTNFRRLVFPLTAIGALLSLGLADNIGRFAKFMTAGGFIPFSFVYAIVIPVLIIVTKMFRPKSRLYEERDTSK